MTNLTNRTSAPDSHTLHSIPSRSSRKILTVSALAAACIAFSACGAIAERVTEEGAERIIEAETGGNVDLDFDSGDGSFSIQTEDGGITVNENGEFVVTGQDGSVFTGSASEDGAISIQGDDGEDVYRVVTDVPAEWPSEIPRPEAITVDAGSYASAGGETLVTLIGAPNNGDAVAYAESYGGALLAAGLTETGRFDSSSGGSTSAQRTYESDRWTVNVSGYVDDASNAVSITLVSRG